MSGNDPRQHVAAVPMFRACSPKELDRIAALFDHVHVPAGREIVTEGSLGRELYVVASGQASVVRGGQEVAVLGPGAYFGELSLIEGGHRNATVVARVPMDLLVLGQRDLARLQADMPSVTRSLLVGITRVLREGDGHWADGEVAASAG